MITFAFARLAKSFLPGSVILCFVCLLSSCEKKDDLDLAAIRASVFKIQVQSAAPRYDQPWLSESPSSSSGTGFYIGDGRILTNAHVVSHAKYITVQRDGRPDVVLARVEYIAHDADLAILNVQTADYLDGVRALQFGGIPVLRKPVSTVGYPMGGEQISVTDGIVSRISFRTYAHHGVDGHLLVQVDSAINPGNSGGPVFQGGEVVGVAFQAFTRAENTGYIIPVPVVERFLKDVQDGRYDGHPRDGLLEMSHALENPAARRYYGLTDDEGGIKISLVAHHSPLKDAIQADDILLRIAGYDIGVDGKISIFGERLDYRILIDLAIAGDDLDFDLIRNGKRQTIRAKVAANAVIDPINNRYQLYPRFLIYGGMIFTSLSRDYVRTWGQSWYYKTPLHLRHLLFHQLIDEDFKKREETIVLLDRLPDPVNQSAQRFTEQVVDKVNGEELRSLNHLAEIFDQQSDNEDKNIVFKFLYNHAPLVLHHRALAERHEPILKLYRVGLERWLENGVDGATARWEGH
ncbi:MAG: PDZ domain-containing protein [Oligoflexus sp.]